MTRRYGPEEPAEAELPLWALARRTDPSTSKSAAASISAATLTSLETRVLEACRAAGGHYSERMIERAIDAADRMRDE